MEGGCEDTYNDNLWGTNCNNLVYTLKQAALCCCSNSHESDGRNCSYHSVTRRELEKCVGLFMISVTEMETVSHILRANCKAELKSAAIFSLLFQLSYICQAGKKNNFPRPIYHHPMTNSL